MTSTDELQRECMYMDHDGDKTNVLRGTPWIGALGAKLPVIAYPVSRTDSARLPSAQTDFHAGI